MELLGEAGVLSELPAAKKDEKSGGGRVAPTCLSVCPTFFDHPKVPQLPFQSYILGILPVRSFSLRLQALPPDATRLPQDGDGPISNSIVRGLTTICHVFVRPDELT
ncbi:hypothetical protein B0T20DRAFT_248450 [Sordaria brevicollis]|uniref:Uncharacterized protein n=1 Tax=Sordaria brevicollis TaxID=83679 RepID=A0AAE0PCI1_SORBR|nr:hypothetical protein B0T20DRAFT_248450 [Sordaria brevicollis]